MSLGLEFITPKDELFEGLLSPEPEDLEAFMLQLRGDRLLAQRGFEQLLSLQSAKIEH